MELPSDLDAEVQPFGANQFPGFCGSTSEPTFSEDKIKIRILPERR